MNTRVDAARLLVLHAQQTTENAIVLLARDGTIQWCNPAAGRIFGYGPLEPVGKPAHGLFTPEDIEQGIPDYELGVAATSDDMHNDRWMSRSDGSRFWATGTMSGLRDDRGELIGFAKTLRNSTDLK